MFLPLHLLHRFEFSLKIRLVKVEKKTTLGCLCPELVPLGSLDPRRLVGAPKLNHCGVKLGGITWEPPIKLWREPRACKGFGRRLQGHRLVDRAILHCTRARGDYGEPLWRLERIVPPHHSNGD